MESSRMDLRKWHVLSLLEADVLKTIRRAWVFYSGGDSKVSVVFTTKDDKVWGLGNMKSFIDIPGNAGNQLKPTMIPYFSNVKIERFSFGDQFMIGITEDGSVIQCGLGILSPVHSTSCMPYPAGYFFGTDQFTELKIVEVECGLHHVLALTSSGQVFVWGRNSSRQCSPGYNINARIIHPCEVRCVPVNDAAFVTSISCGPSSSYAVLNDGRVYFWGRNHIGDIICEPTQVASLANDFIIKIVCGLEHTLALSRLGDLYAWGKNCCGEVGTGDLFECPSPREISWNHDRIINIAAIRTARISVAVTDNLDVYVWGLCGGFKVLEPQLSQYNTVQEVFCNLSNTAESYGFIENVDFLGSAVVQQNSINRTLEAAFNDHESSDFKIVIDNEEIHAHKTILILRDKYFQRLFAGDWKEGKENVMTVENRTYSVYKEFLRYLYTDQVDVTFEDAFELLDIADEHLNESLKEVCSATIKRGIDVENVASMFARADSTKMDELKQYCLTFIFKHMNAVTQSQAFEELESDYQLQIFKSASQNNLFKS